MCFYSLSLQEQDEKKAPEQKRTERRNSDPKRYLDPQKKAGFGGENQTGYI